MQPLGSLEREREKYLPYSMLPELNISLIPPISTLFFLIPFTLNKFSKSRTNIVLNTR